MRRSGALAGFILAIFGFALFAVAPAIRAQPAPAQGIQISPVLIDLNADQGKNYTLKLTVTNVAATDLNLTMSVNDFRAKDETGDPAIIPDDESDASFSFRQWVTPIAPFSLKPKESRAVNVMVNVPNNAEAGGHYGVIRFNGSLPGGDANVGIAASVGSLVLTRVSGDITEQLEVEGFFVEKGGKQGGFFESSPFTIVERLKNTGNIHVKPTGTLTVKNMLGKVVETQPINNPPGNVLPDSTRRFQQDINKKWMFGKYTASMEVAYGTNGQVLNATTTFWVVPFKLIFIVLLTLLVVILLTRVLVKRHNRRVIARAKRNNRF